MPVMLCEIITMQNYINYSNYAKLRDNFAKSQMEKESFTQYRAKLETKVKCFWCSLILQFLFNSICQHNSSKFC